MLTAIYKIKSLLGELFLWEKVIKKQNAERFLPEATENFVRSRKNCKSKKEKKIKTAIVKKKIKNNSAIWVLGEQERLKMMMRWIG